MRINAFILLFLCFSAGLSAQDENEPNNSFTEAKSLTLVDRTVSTSGMIDPAGDADYFVVNIAEPGVLDIVVYEVTGGVDMYVEVFDFEQNPLGSTYEVNSERVPFSVQACDPGTYYIKLSDSGNSDVTDTPYQLEITLDRQDIYECNNSFLQAKPITFGDTITGTIKSSGDVDYYSINIPRGGVIDVDVYNVTGGVDMYIELFNSQQGPEGSAYEINSPRAELDQLVCNPGTYYIKLSDSGNSDVTDQPYKMMVQFDTTDIYECNNNFTDAKKIPLDEIITGTIRSSGDQDYYAVDVLRDGVIDVNVYNVTGGVDMYIEIFDPQQGPLASRYVVNDNRIDLNKLVCSAGTYFIKLSDSGNSDVTETPYQMTVVFDSTDTFECNNNFTDAKQVALGDTIAGTIRSAGDEDYFMVNVPRAGIMDLEVYNVTGGVDMYIEVFDSLQVPVSSTYVVNAPRVELSPQVCSAGTYYVKLSDSGNSDVTDEPYQFALNLDTTDTYECNNQFATPAVVQFCDTIRATIYPSSDLDYYAFQPLDGDSVTISTVSSYEDITIEATLYNLEQVVISEQSLMPGTPLRVGGLNAEQYILKIEASRSSAFSRDLYAIFLENGAGCNTTGVTDLIQNDLITAYPNPTQDKINVTFDGEIKGATMNLKVLDVSGRIVLSQDDVKSGSTINLSDLAAGMHILQFENESVRSVLRVVKQR